jgi:hypothetical protein
MRAVALWLAGPCRPDWDGVAAAVQVKPGYGDHTGSDSSAERTEAITGLQ